MGRQLGFGFGKGRRVITPATHDWDARARFDAREPQVKEIRGSRAQRLRMAKAHLRTPQRDGRT